MILEKVPGKLRGKLVLEKVPDEMRGKLIESDTKSAVFGHNFRALTYIGKIS